MSWLQLELETPQAQAEELSELLEQLGAVSVSLTAASDEPVFDTQMLDQPEQQLWDKTRLLALLHPDADLDILLVCLRDRVGAENIFNHRIKLIRDKDWVSEFKGQHQPIIFSDSICICPSWCEAPDNALPTIILDPGLAFGTGTHPTTSLCIEWLCQNDIKDKLVIDYGCGSGILAMVAALLGAKQVFAVDIDPQAVQAAQDNIANNKLSPKINVDLVENIKLPQTDILIANILMNPLTNLVDTFSCLTHAGSDIVLSGLLHVQAEDCLAAYASCFKMDEPVFNAEWTRLHGTKV